MGDDTLMDIHEHGVWVDKKNKRVKCNYCGKQICHFSRLKFHLGGVAGQVAPCDHAPSNVRETFRSMVLKQKLGSAAKRAGKLQMCNVQNKRGKTETSSTKSVSPEKGNTTNVEEANKHDMDLQSNNSLKCIGRFFYENGIDFSAVDSPGFRNMMSLGGGEVGLSIPGSHDLNGWMLQELLREVEDHVQKIKDSWAITGCSILLDAWVDQKGRELVTFVADCPAGPVYLKSFDVSDIKHNSKALMSLVDGLVDEVGVDNVVQIIACSASGWVGELGESYVCNKKGVFWSVSVSHCFELMLLKIVEIDSFKDILDKVNNITEFLYNNHLVWEVFKDPSHGEDMTVSSSEFEFVTPYLTLENILKAKNNLAAMFASSDWNKEEADITISKLVNDLSFWESVERILKTTSPLVRGLHLFSSSTANNQDVGYIYDTMNVLKESIAKELNNEKLCYMPVWDVIDDVWNKHLHSPLHAAGYFLNPSAFYSADFYLDTEVATGLISSLVHMIKELDIQVKVATQLDMYRVREGCFNETSQADEISPAEWWAQKASEQPELQSFAVKILSQTCEGASRYKLKRSVAEKLLLTRGMSRGEKQHLEEIAFVHYNLHLQSYKLSEEK